MICIKFGGHALECNDARLAPRYVIALVLAKNLAGASPLVMWSIYLNVVVQGVLTGLVYGLMALGLSVIFGVVRVVNFAHGEFAVVAMYTTFVLFKTSGIDPLLLLLPIAAAFFVAGFILQTVLINAFVERPEHD